MTGPEILGLPRRLVLFRYGREIARQPDAMGAVDIVRWPTSHT